MLAVEIRINGDIFVLFLLYTVSVDWITIKSLLDMRHIVDCGVAYTNSCCNVEIIHIDSKRLCSIKICGPNSLYTSYYSFMSTCLMGMMMIVLLTFHYNFLTLNTLIVVS